MRCFVACWPDPATRSHLDHAAQGLHARYPGSRRMRAENLHLTLAFIGELPQSMASEVASAMADLSVAPFAWHVDRFGRFDRAHIVWAGGPEEPRLAQLAERVRGRLQALQVRFDRKPFAAHVTLLRDVPAREPAPGRPEPNQAIEPIHWPIEAARLVVSEREARGATRYRLLEPA
jgi:2'-5' RNA ligase